MSAYIFSAVFWLFFFCVFVEGAGGMVSAQIVLSHTIMFNWRKVNWNIFKHKYIFNAIFFIKKIALARLRTRINNNCKFFFPFKESCDSKKCIIDSCWWLLVLLHICFEYLQINNLTLIWNFFKKRNFVYFYWNSFAVIRGFTMLRIILWIPRFRKAYIK